MTSMVYNNLYIKHAHQTPLLTESFVVGAPVQTGETHIEVAMIRLLVARMSRTTSLCAKLDG
jgi:hypothetical protein